MDKRQFSPNDSFESLDRDLRRGNGTEKKPVNDREPETLDEIVTEPEIHIDAATIATPIPKPKRRKMPAKAKLSPYTEVSNWLFLIKKFIIVAW